MTLAVDVQLDPFHSCVEGFLSQITPSPERAKAIAALQKMGLPTKKNEAYSYVPLREMYSKTFSFSQSASLSSDNINPHIYPECSGSALVFINGEFSLEHSRLSSLQGITILPLSAAKKGGYSSFLQKRIQQRIETETDPFILLNLALSQEGAFVFVPPKQEVVAPIQCLFVTTHDETASFPRAYLTLGAQAKASFVTSYVHMGTEKGGFQNAFIDVSLDDLSQCEHTLYMNTPKESHSLFAMRASLKKESRIDCKNLTPGSKLTRQDYLFTILAEGADASVSGLSWLERNYESHVHVLVDHKAPNCTSNQFIKGVLSDAAHSSFTGKILVRKEAQKTQAYQLNNNLLLTEGTIAYSKPGLEILADDVKASHGATISQLDDEQLFYLKTRGLSLDVAKMLLVLGFCRDILDKVPLESLRKELAQSIEKYLKVKPVC